MISPTPNFFAWLIQNLPQVTLSGIKTTVNITLVDQGQGRGHYSVTFSISRKPATPRIIFEISPDTLQSNLICVFTSDQETEDLERLFHDWFLKHKKFIATYHQVPTITRAEYDKYASRVQKLLQAVKMESEATKGKVVSDIMRVLDGHQKLIVG